MFVHCCHCTWCQRESGAAFALNALIEADRVVLLAGEPEIVETPDLLQRQSSKVSSLSKVPHSPVEQLCHGRGGSKCASSAWEPWMSLRGCRLTSTYTPQPNSRGWNWGRSVQSRSEFYDRSEFWPSESLKPGLQLWRQLSICAARPCRAAQKVISLLIAHRQR